MWLFFCLFSQQKCSYLQSHQRNVIFNLKQRHPGCFCPTPSIHPTPCEKNLHSSQSTEAWIWCLVLHDANSEHMTTPGSDTNVIKHILILDCSKSAVNSFSSNHEGIEAKNKFLIYWSMFQPSPVVMKYDLKQDSFWLLQTWSFLMNLHRPVWS